MSRSPFGRIRGLVVAGICDVLAIALCWNLACASPQGQAGRDPKAVKETKMKDDNPFEIRLTSHGNDIRAVLVNRSQAALPVLTGADLQPSQLKLISAAGRKPSYFDSRDIKKFDNTPYCHRFQNLAPGRELELGTARFKKSGSEFSASWGPFTFDQLPAGDYRAEVSWRSEYEQCFDESTKQMRKVPSIWTGVVRSNEVSLQLR